MAKRWLRKGVISTISAIALLAIEMVSVSATTTVIKGQTLHELCTTFPLNSQCQDFEAIPLSKRGGTTANCSFNSNNVEIQGECKIQVDQEGLLIHQEAGEGSSRWVRITPQKFNSFVYEDIEIDNVEKTLINYFLFGIAGAASTPKIKLAKIEINYNSQHRNTSTLVVIIGRDKGSELRSQLEKLTTPQVNTPAIPPQP
ncbi:hypothetical protein [Calothrix sp. NIES-3974]|uniref:hypothetical protein n=1 Tax=Calothrix sp. NIES-3974 TaxID=2005462 RepID=UPI000B62329A|nr:hypothetical protein [Calothrix sp. NIES-3974]BAZ06472.1 hypothetical protein NIES3974_31330 [Calothrix sp. NIES-3974]